MSLSSEALEKWTTSHDENIPGSDSSAWETESESETSTESHISTNEEKASWLCDDCRSLDLAKAFSRPFKNRKQAERGLSLSSRKTLVPGCALCKELERHCRWGKSHVFELRAFPCPMSMTGVVAQRPSLRRVNVRWLYAVDVDHWVRIKTLDIEDPFIVGKFGWTACFPTPIPPVQHIGTLRPIPENFEPSMAKEWIATCEKHHLDRCNKAVDRPIGFVVLDCQSLEIVACPPSAKYVALSYVWGIRKKSEMAQLTVEERVWSPSKTISDAINLTKLLEMRYLWVDQYCINQADENIRHEQIECMDQVYQGADLTIIAAAGNDQHHGLAGIGIRRIHRPMLEKDGFNIYTAPSEDHIPGRVPKWHTRAWTFQEEKLSRRRLYLYNTHARFICGEMYCSESFWGVELIQGKEGVARYSRFSSIRFGEDAEYSIYEMHGQPDHESAQKYLFLRIATLVEMYSSRNMTYDSDTLRAFAAIRRLFERNRIPVYTLQGLPVPVTDFFSVEVAEHRITMALLWNHTDHGHPQRRNGFPSWTWAGWHGAIHFPGPNENYGSHEWKLHPKKMSFGYPDQSLVALELLWERLLGKRGSQIHPSTDLLNPTSVTFRALSVAAECFEGSRDYWGMIRFLGVSFNLVSGVNFEASRDHHLPFRPFTLISGLRSRVMDCIFMGCLEQRRMIRLWLLVIGRSSKERIGLLTLQLVDLADWKKVEQGLLALQMEWFELR